jgi:hypothetical protein
VNPTHLSPRRILLPLGLSVPQVDGAKFCRKVEGKGPGHTRTVPVTSVLARQLLSQAKFTSQIKDMTDAQNACRTEPLLPPPALP